MLKKLRMFTTFDTVHERDRRTPHDGMAALCIASRGKTTEDDTQRLNGLHPFISGPKYPLNC